MALVELQLIFDHLGIDMRESESAPRQRRVRLYVCVFGPPPGSKRKVVRNIENLHRILGKGEEKTEERNK